MQGMRDLLRGSLARSLRPLPELDRLAAAWPVACGSALAGHAEIVGYNRGTVQIVVASAEWMEPLAQMRGILSSDLARIAGVPVTAIHFENADKKFEQSRAAEKAIREKQKRDRAR